jgi:hypothetical protein
VRRAKWTQREQREEHAKDAELRNRGERGEEYRKVRRVETRGGRRKRRMRSTDRLRNAKLVMCTDIALGIVAESAARREDCEVFTQCLRPEALER